MVRVPYLFNRVVMLVTPIICVVCFSFHHTRKDSFFPNCTNCGTKKTKTPANWWQRFGGNVYFIKKTYSSQYLLSAKSWMTFCSLASFPSSVERKFQNAFLWCMYFKCVFSWRIVWSIISYGKMTMRGDSHICLYAEHWPRIPLRNFFTVTDFAQSWCLFSNSCSRLGRTILARSITASRIVSRSHFWSQIFSKFISSE